MTRYELGVLKVAEAYGVDASALLEKVAERDHDSGALTGALLGGGAGAGAGAGMAGSVLMAPRLPAVKALEGNPELRKNTIKSLLKQFGIAKSKIRGAEGAKLLKSLATKADKLARRQRHGAAIGALAGLGLLGTAGGAAIGGLVGKNKGNA